MAEHKLHLIISLFALRRYPYNYIFFVIDNVGASSEEITQSSRSRRLRPSCEREPRPTTRRAPPHRVVPAPRRARTVLITRRISLLADGSLGDSYSSARPATRTGTLHAIVTTVYVSHNQPQIDSLDINNIFGYVIVSR